MILSPLNINNAQRTIPWLQLIKEKYNLDNLMNAEIRSKFAIIDSNSPINNLLSIISR